eukprot:TRINITY_DN67693_c6_g1_i1.p1 TRINITY_DN67693_c6_g1~~TRINITY_DN67693_c6_g1_i1.p1  ORF type:complete len:219 (+),score=10.45 TRINITY_DN67693_c6_g1_i1:53-709(+)
MSTNLGLGITSDGNTYNQRYQLCREMAHKDVSYQIKQLIKMQNGELGPIIPISEELTRDEVAIKRGKKRFEVDTWSGRACPFATMSHVSYANDTESQAYGLAVTKKQQPPATWSPNGTHTHTPTQGTVSPALSHGTPSRSHSPTASTPKPRPNKPTRATRATNRTFVSNIFGTDDDALDSFMKPDQLARGKRRQQWQSEATPGLAGANRSKSYPYSLH